MAAAVSPMSGTRSKGFPPLAGPAVTGQLPALVRLLPDGAGCSEETLVLWGETQLLFAYEEHR